MVPADHTSLGRHRAHSLQVGEAKVIFEFIDPSDTFFFFDNDSAF